MLYYRFYLLNAVGVTVDRESAYCASDREAFVKARELCKSHDIEVWQGTKKLLVVNCEKLRASLRENAEHSEHVGQSGARSGDG